MLGSDSSPLRQLVDIISESVDAIDVSFTKNKLAYPNFDAPFDPASPSEVASMDPDVVQAGLLIVAACAQLMATVKIPAHSVYDVAGGVSCTVKAHITCRITHIPSFQFHVSSALRVAFGK